MPNLTVEEQRRQDEIQAALARSQSFSDGRRRVVPIRDQSITIGHGMLTFFANQIIEDPYVIMTMESYGIEFVELNVNDKRRRPVADEARGQFVVNGDQVTSLARGLGVARDVLLDALTGQQPQIDRAVAMITDELAARHLQGQQSGAAAPPAEPLAAETPPADGEQSPPDDGEFVPGTPPV
jgi:hypothetical protein